MLNIFNKQVLFSLKKVLLYSTYSTLFSLCLFIIDLIFKTHYGCMFSITVISIIRFITLSTITYLYYYKKKIKFKINISIILKIALIIDLIVLLLCKSFNVFLIYLKVSCSSTVIPIYFMLKFDFISKIINYCKNKLGYINYNYLKLFLCFIIYSNFLFFFSGVLLFILYDFIIDEILTISALSIILYGFVKFFIGLIFANILSKQKFFINHLQQKINKICLYFFVWDTFVFIIYYIFSGVILNTRDYFGILFNFSLLFAYLPFYIFYLINNSFKNKQSHLI